MPGDWKQPPSAEEAAKWFVVGFCRCWSMRQWLSSLGMTVANKEQQAEVHAAYPFIPTFWFMTTPIRAIVNAEYPALHRYLDNNRSNPEKLLRAITQVMRLKALDRMRHVRSHADIKELAQSRKEMRVATTQRRQDKKVRESGSRSAWGVCKGTRAR